MIGRYGAAEIVLAPNVAPRAEVVIRNRLDVIEEEPDIAVEQPAVVVDQQILQQDNMAEDQQQPANMPNNRIAASLKPQSFDASRLDLAGKWLTSFNRYCDFAGVAGADRCMLMGLLMKGTAETWFNSLPQDTRNDYALLEPVFRERYVDSEVTRMQRQMATLQKTQLTGESVDAYFTDAQSKLAEHNFPANLVMTLLINGLRSDIKGLVMQHQPFDNVDDLLNKARHIESSLRSSPVNPYLTQTSPVVAAVAKKDLFATFGDLDDMQDAMVAKILKGVKEINVKQKTAPQYVVPKVDPRAGSITPPVGSCFSCGRTDHFARDCRYDRSKVNRNPPPVGRYPRSSSRGRPRNVTFRAPTSAPQWNPSYRRDGNERPGTPYPRNFSQGNE